MFRSGTSFSGCNMWVVDKAKLIAGALTVTGFPQTFTGTNMYTPQGVHNDDASATNGYFIGASQTLYSRLVIRRVNYGVTPTLSGDLNITTSTVYSPKTVPTLGGIAIDGGDWRLYAAMIKRNKITGAVLLLIALLLFIAFTSYLFTWEEDQDKVLNTGSSLFWGGDAKVNNLLGTLGAYLSHLFIYRGFGVASYLICSLFFVTGINLFFGKKVFSVSRNIKYVLVGLIVLCVAFAVVFDGTRFRYGGNVGPNEACQLLSL